MTARTSLRVAMVQANTVVGDVEGNAARLVAALDAAQGAGADLVAGPELAITGYPPEDLLLKPSLLAANVQAVEAVAAHTTTSVALIGFVDLVGASAEHAVADAISVGRAAREAAVVGAPRRLRNAVAVCAGGRVVAIYHKRKLPNHGVFDERRWFTPGTDPLCLVDVTGVPVGVSICEDLWFADGPVPALGRGGAAIIVNVNASPFSVGRLDDRLAVLRQRAREAGCPVVYVNQVGGQDELVFDGGSMVVGADGAVVAGAARFTETVALVDVPVDLADDAGGGRPSALPVVATGAAGGAGGPGGEPAVGAVAQATPGTVWPAMRGAVARAAADTGTGAALGTVEWATPGSVPQVALDLLGPTSGAPTSPGTQAAPGTAAGFGATIGSTSGTASDAGAAEIYAALVLGTRDYVTKNGFADVVIGLSGGIDSSLVATVAVDALGHERVHGVAMPSRYSSRGSRRDADALARGLGIDLLTIPIEPAHQAVTAMLDEVGVAVTGATDENLQSRIRGVVLMALSNARGWLVLTTGNKSELATGYSTLYGDSAGGFAVIKDVAKTTVYRLCRYRNALAGTDLVPTAVLQKPPSAELRPDQRDEDSLPPYDVLDRVLGALVERDHPAAELVAEGVDPATVVQVARLVDQAEYKRRQSPPGVRITPRAFGKDRRMPITHRYVEPVPVPPAGSALEPEGARHRGGS